MRIDLGTLSFNTGTADANGTFWYATEMDGWDSEDVRIQTFEPDLQQGVVITTLLKAPRALTITGVSKSPSENAFWTAYNGLDSVLPISMTSVAFKVYESTGTKQVMVHRAGRIRKRFVGVGAFEFEIPMIAPSPDKT